MSVNQDSSYELWVCASTLQNLLDSLITHLSDLIPRAFLFFKLQKVVNPETVRPVAVLESSLNDLLS